jgi:hypothetical protein
MKVLILILLWCVLFVLYWPLAIAVLILLPILWLLSIGFRLVIWAVEAFLALIKAMLFLPARLLGYRKGC